MSLNESSQNTLPPQKNEAPEALLDVRDLSKSFPSGEETLMALNNVSFQIKSGQSLAITGPSGSGKSTLLNILGTLDTPTSGEVLIQGHNPFTGGDGSISAFRNQTLGFVFQQNNLLADFTALENVMMPALLGKKGVKKKIHQERALELLDAVGLTKRKDHFPTQMSGGEQQRVAIARALMNRPLLLLADEPSASLDSENAKKVHDVLLKVNQQHKTTLVVVTHNPDFAAQLEGRLELSDGRVMNLIF